MTKPRFVVDPVPDLAGLDPREQQQAFMAWAQRQFDRIHDWWPKDSEDRLIALEELNTKIKGFWPIVDYSIVQFDGTASVQQIAVECTPTTATFGGSFNYTSIQTVGSYFEITFKPDGTKMYAGDSAFGTLAPGISEFTLSTPFDVTTATFVQHEAAGFSPYGSYIHPDGDRIFMINLAFSGSNTETLVEYELGAAWDISTLAGSPVHNLSLYTEYSKPMWLSFSRDGEHFYTGRNISGSGTIHQWDLSTAWDITTASYIGSRDLQAVSGSPLTTWLMRTAIWDEAGKNVLVQGLGASLHLFTTASAFNVSGLSYVQEILTNGSNEIYGGYVGDDCQFLVVSDPTNKKFHYYELG